MEVSKYLLFFFSAIGAFNGILLSLYFLFLKRLQNNSHYFLAGLLLALSIRIVKSVFFFFNPDLSKDFLQLGLSACFMIGPFLLAYVLSTLNDSKRVFYISVTGLISLILLIGVVGYLYPYSSRPDLWGGAFYKGINYIWMLFVVLSMNIAQASIRKLWRQKGKLSYSEIVMLNVLIGSFIVWVAYFFSSYTSYIVGAISFTFVLYLSIFLLYFQRKASKEKKNNKSRYTNKIDTEEVAELVKKMKALIEQEAIYKDPNITLPEFSKKLHERPHLISQVLNDNLKINFTNFINLYRIEEAKKLLLKQKNLKVEVISEMCGFNSTSAFYTAFKKVTNTTPSKFISENE